VKKKKEGTSHKGNSVSHKLLKAHLSQFECKSVADGELVASRAFLRSSLNAMFGMDKTYSIPVVYSIALTSTAGGVINNSIADSTGMAAAAGWSPAATIFDECRLREVRVNIEPTNKYSKTVALSRPILMVYDDDSIGTLGAYQQQYTTSHYSNTDDLFHRPCVFKKPTSSVYLNQWQTTASLATTGGVMFYADTLSATTNYGVLWIWYIVDFRQT
jgi:hypothetical protein